MTGKLALRIIWMGFLTWLVPFVVSLFLYSRQGQPIVPVTTFKAIMCVVGNGTGVWLLAWLFRRGLPLAQAGLVVGGAWMVMNLVLDLVVLVPMAGMSIGTYLGTIGLTYVSLPIIAVAMQVVADGRAIPGK